MKKEASKKSKLWLWLTIALAGLLVIAGTVLGIVMLGGQGEKTVDDGRPDLYWNLDRDTYFEKGALSSSREKAEDGYYHIRFAFDGEQIEALTADKQLVNYIDTMSVMGLVFDGDGYIVDAVAVKELATVVGEDIYVQSLGEGVININSSVVMNGLKKTLELTELAVIYDVSAKAEVGGTPVAQDTLGVMDKLSVYGDANGTITHVFLTGHPKESKVYWRANQFVSGGKTTRVPDENGYYTIPFYCEGEYVEFKCKDVVEVNYIDKQSFYSCHFGLVFDDDGYIIEAIHSYEAIRGMVRSERFDVTGIEGNKITTTKVIGSNAGTTDAFVLPEGCPIYDVSYAAKAEDRTGKRVDSLQMGDRIVCFADAEGNPLFVYVAERIVEEAVWCYSRTRKYDSTLLETTRVPDANGWYTIEVFAEGEVKTIKTKDKAVATEIDAIGARVFGVTLNGDEIVEVYNVYSVFGYNAFGQGRYITSVSGSIFSCFKTSAPDKIITGVMRPECKIWNLSEVGTYGEETKLQYGDYIYAYQDPYLQMVQIWVMRRKVDAPIYVSLNRMYDSKNKVTTRVADQDGWYVFDMITEGKRTTVKTQSKALATKMDAFSPAEMTLVVGSNGVVYEAYSAACSNGGYRRASGYKVVSINSDGTVDTVYTKTGATRKLTLTDDTKIYNTGEIYQKSRGELTTLRVGDIIASFNDIYDKAAVIHVRSRQAGTLYWNTQKMYDDTNKVSTRVPDADGWYVYQLANEGKVATYKTKDKELADKLDYYGGAFVIVHDDGIIRCVASPSYAKDSVGSSLLNYDVVKVSGSRVTLKYNSQGSSKDGEVITVSLTSNVKIFDVSPTAKNFGEKVKLQVGDRVRAYQAEEGDAYTYVFIRYHDTHKGGSEGYCEACKKNVYWTPWMGGSFSTAGGHFYLNASMETPDLPCSTGRSTFPTCTVCLDLNGNTYNRTKGRALYVYANATLNIMDSVGTGEVVSYGIDQGKSGGVLGIPGGTVNMYGGTLRLSEEHAEMVRGGVLVVSVGGEEKKTKGTFNMYGGKITGGEVLGRGGNVSVEGGILNLYDGIIENGNVIGGYSGEHGGGGNILTLSNGIFNMYGGTVTGGTCYAAGGNIYGGTGEVNIFGGTISDGTALNSGGGNIYAIEKLYIEGGTISGGVSEKKAGGNIYVLKYNDNSGLAMVGGTVTGGSAVAYGGNIYAETEVLLADATITDGKANSGGNIYVNKDTVISGCTISGGVTMEAKGSGGNLYAGGGRIVLEKSTITGGISGARGGNIYSASAEIYMLSGTLSGGVSGFGNANGGGNICTISNGVFYLVDGTVSDGISANTGGNILSGSGGLHILGGTVSGGTAPKAGADIYVYGGSTDVTLGGGNIGTMEIAAVKSLAMAGKPVFENLIFGGGVVADITELDKNAQIPLTADGVITAALEVPADYMNCFVPVADGYTLYMEGGALAMGAGVKTGACAHCNETVNWQLWNGTGADGHYYLNDTVNMTEEVTVPAGAELVLDLAGNKAESSARAFNVNEGKLVIMDSVDGGQIIGSGSGEKFDGGVFYVDGGAFALLGGTVRYSETAAGARRGGVLHMQGEAVVDLRGGVITDGRTTERGGNIYVGAGQLNLCGTTVQNGTANSSNANGGGNIFLLGNSVTTMTAGAVLGGNTTKTGGNICVGTATFIMEGGEISGGNATGAGPDLYVYYSGSNAEIKGGKIANLTYKDAESFKLSGNPEIGELDVVTQGKLVELGELTDGADIKVKAVGVFTTENANAQSFVDAAYVKAADAANEITVVDNQLSVTAAPVIPEGATVAPCEHCGGQDALWYKWESGCADGHYYLEGRTDVTVETEIPEGSTLVLDLKGNTFSNAATRAFYVYGGLAILDSVGGGDVVGSGAGSSWVGGVIRVNGGTFDLYNGIIRYSTEAAGAKQGGVLYMQGEAVVNLRGGVITDGRTTERGGNIYVGAGQLNLCGATVQNGTANSSNANGGGNIFMLGNSVTTMTAGAVLGGNTTKTGGNICVGTATFIMEGGEISGGRSTGVGPDLYVYYSGSNAEIKGGNITNLTYKDAASFKLSGNPNIGKLEITAGKLVELGEMTEGAVVRVIGNGVFTDETDNAAVALEKGYITTFDSYGLELVNKALSVSFDPSHRCAHCEKAVEWAAWDGTAVNGHYYLTQNMSATDMLTVAAENTLVLDLNGYKLTNSSHRVFYVYGELAVMDLTNGGEIIGAEAGDSIQGGVIRVNGGKFTLHSGTLRYSEAAAGVKQGGVLYVQNGATVDLLGGVITGGRSAERGGNLYVNNANTVVTLSGAIISDGHSGLGNTAVGGGNVFVLGGALFNMTDGSIVNGIADNYGGNVGVGSGSFRMSGGLVSGGSAGIHAPDVYVYYKDSKAEITGGTIGTVTYKDSAQFLLSGKPVIERFEITAGKTVTLGDLVEGANITVDGEGVFTSANTKAAAFVENGWIKAVDGKQVTARDDMLSVDAVTLFGRLAKLCAAIF